MTFTSTSYNIKFNLNFRRKITEAKFKKDTHPFSFF